MGFDVDLENGGRDNVEATGGDPQTFTNKDGVVYIKGVTGRLVEFDGTVSGLAPVEEKLDTLLGGPDDPDVEDEFDDDDDDDDLDDDDFAPLEFVGEVVDPENLDPSDPQWVPAPVEAGEESDNDDESVG